MLLALLMVTLAVTCVLGLFLIWRRRRGAAGEPWPRSERLTLTGVIVSATVSLVTLLVNTLYGGSGTSATPTSKTTTTPASTVTPDTGAGDQVPPDTDLRVAALTISDADERNQGPTLGIRLRNIGPHVSALTAVSLTVRTFGILNICEAGGVSTPTAAYPVAMPVPAEPGTVVTAPISQDLSANTADNFQLIVGVAPFTTTISQASAYFVYLVEWPLSTTAMPLHWRPGQLFSWCRRTAQRLPHRAMATPNSLWTRMRQISPSKGMWRALCLTVTAQTGRCSHARRRATGRNRRRWSAHPESPTDDHSGRCLKCGT